MSTVEAISGDAIFDAARYDLPIPSQDGHKADKLIVSMSGGLELDRTSEEDLAFIEGLMLGQEVTLTVTNSNGGTVAATATVTKKGFTFTPGKDEGPPQAGYGVGIRVHTLEAA